MDTATCGHPTSEMSCCLQGLSPVHRHTHCRSRSADRCEGKKGGKQQDSCQLLVIHWFIRQSIGCAMSQFLLSVCQAHWNINIDIKRYTKQETVATLKNKDVKVRRHTRKAMQNIITFDVEMTVLESVCLLLINHYQLFT